MGYLISTYTLLLPSCHNGSSFTVRTNFSMSYGKRSGKGCPAPAILKHLRGLYDLLQKQHTQNEQHQFCSFAPQQSAPLTRHSSPLSSHFIVNSSATKRPSRRNQGYSASIVPSLGWGFSLKSCALCPKSPIVVSKWNMEPGEVIPCSGGRAWAIRFRLPPRSLDWSITWLPGSVLAQYSSKRRRLGSVSSSPMARNLVLNFQLCTRGKRRWQWWRLLWEGGSIQQQITKERMPISHSHTFHPCSLSVANIFTWLALSHDLLSDEYEIFWRNQLHFRP